MVHSFNLDGLDGLDESTFGRGDTKFTGKDCLTYMIFAKAFMLLPESERAETENEPLSYEKKIIKKIR